MNSGQRPGPLPESDPTVVRPERSRIGAIQGNGPPGVGVAQVAVTVIQHTRCTSSATIGGSGSGGVVR